MRILNIVSFVLGLFLTANALSDSTRLVAQQSASAKIQAINSTIDLRHGINTFVGDVLVDHIAFDLYADELVEHRGIAGTERIIATGSPVTFAQNKPFSERISHGHASKIEFDESTRELHMWDYTVTDVTGTVMSGKKVVYLLLR